MKHDVTLDECPGLTRHPEAYQQFVDGYLAARGDRQLPLLSDCLVGDLVPLLPDVNVFELVRPGFISYRFSGTAIAQRVGLDATGMNMLDFLAPESRDMAESDIRHLAEVPCGGYSRYENAFEGGRRTEAETVLLPVIVDPKADSRALITLNLVEARSIDLEYRDQTIIGARWIQARVIDIGFGCPDVAEMSDLYRQVHPGV